MATKSSRERGIGLEPHRHTVQIYYDDTDLSGVVYHANYLRYFEHAREHIIGPQRLAQLFQEGVGFVVYRASLNYKDGARLGDSIEIRSTYERVSAYRVQFKQAAWRAERLLVEGEVELVCVGPDRNVVPLPEW